MTAQIIAFPRRADIITALRESGKCILLMVLAKDEQAQADLQVRFET
jgi:hypothetical protein